MKKLSFVFATLLGVSVMLTSCDKKGDYVCTCTVAGTTTSSPMNDVKESDAEDACDALHTAAQAAGGSCVLSEK